MCLLFAALPTEGLWIFFLSYFLLISFWLNIPGQHTDRTLWPHFNQYKCKNVYIEVYLDEKRGGGQGGWNGLLH